MPARLRSLVAAVSCLAAGATSIQQTIASLSDCDVALDKQYPRQYVAHFTSTPPELDGKLDEPLWTEVPWTEDFVDIYQGPTPRKLTKAKIRWDHEFVYFAAFLQEDELWANVTKDNEVIFFDNDFEIFMDPGGTTHYYKEFEMNARGKTWALCLNKPYLNGGYENSSRVFPSDEAYHLRSRVGVHIDGVLNDATKVGKSWSVEVALPIADLLVNQSNAEPAADKFWRLGFNRVEWRVLRERNQFVRDPAYPHEDNWVWQNMGAINMHLPERWGLVQFADAQVRTDSRKVDPTFRVRHQAAVVYDLMFQYYQQHNNTFTEDVAKLIEGADQSQKDLFVSKSGDWCGLKPSVTLRDGGSGYDAVISDGSTWQATIRDDRLLEVEDITVML